MVIDSAHRRIALGIAAVSLAGAAAGAARQAPYRSGVDVVVVDAAVVDGSGRPAGDLRAEDFRVTVDGRPRKIVSAQFLSYGVGGTREPASPNRAPTAPAAPAPPIPTSPGNPPRNIVIVADEPSLEIGSTRDATLAATAFLDRLTPADRVAFVVLPWLPDRLVLTSDRAQLRKDLDRVVGTPPPLAPRFTVTLAEALAIRRGDDALLSAVARRECRDGTDAGVCRSLIAIEAGNVVFVAETKADRSLDALLRLVETLRAVEGPKTVVLISGGMAPRETSRSFAALEAAFAAVQVRLYVLRLKRWDFDLSRQSTTRALGRPIDENAGESILSLGVEQLASAAGGVVIPVLGSAEGSLGRVLQEVSAFYLLGIEPLDADRDGRPHQIRVAVTRRGLQVRARRRFLIAGRPALGRGDPAVPPDPGLPPASPSPGDHPPPGVPPPPSPDVEAALVRAGQYVAEYQNAFSVLAAEEDAEQSAFSRPSATEGWWNAGSRHVVAEYVLVRSPEGRGWIPFRDVCEVDGKRIPDRGGRLAALFSQAPSDSLDQAGRITVESRRYNIGDFERNISLPTLALLFLDDANRARFVFRRLKQEKVQGVATWALALAEWRRPAFIRWNDRDVPAEGTLSVDPQTGRVIRTTLRLEPESGEVEVTVTYRPDAGLGIWVPAEVRERYLRPNARVECVSQYTGFRRLR